MRHQATFTIEIGAKHFRASSLECKKKGCVMEITIDIVSEAIIGGLGLGVCLVGINLALSMLKGGVQ